MTHLYKLQTESTTSQVDTGAIISQENILSQQIQNISMKYTWVGDTYTQLVHIHKSWKLEEEKIDNWTVRGFLIWE